MTDVVTGASGHLGANLVRALVAEDRPVRVLLRGPAAALDGLGVEVAHGDVRDPASLEKAFRGAATVYHLAAEISIHGDRGGLVPATNVDGARNVAAAALATGVERLVHVCSVHAFSQAPLEQPVTESRARVVQHPSTPAYDRSKAAGEAAVRAFLDDGLDLVVVYPSGVVGPHDCKPSRIGRFLLALYHGRVPALVAGGFDWVDVRDVVTGTIAAARCGRRGAGYILSGRWASAAELAALVAAEPGAAPAPARLVPMWLARLAAPLSPLVPARLTGGEPLFTSESLRALRANHVFDHGRARAELGYTARPLESTVRDLFAWFAERGALARRRPR